MLNKIDVIDIMVKVVMEVITFAIIFCAVAVFTTAIGVLTQGDVRAVILVLLIVIYFVSNIIVKNGK